MKRSRTFPEPENSSAPTAAGQKMSKPTEAERHIKQLFDPLASSKAE